MNVTGWVIGQGGLRPELLLMLGLMFVILWFMMIRPQRQREARRREMMNQLKKSDHVITIGGIHGVITQVRGDEVVLKVDESNNVKITFTRSAIARVIDKSAEGEGAAEKADKADKSE